MFLSYMLKIISYKLIGIRYKIVSRVKKKKVLFIGESIFDFQEINRNISSFHFEKKMMDINENKTKKIIKFALQSGVIFTDKNYDFLKAINLNKNIVILVSPSINVEEDRATEKQKKARQKMLVKNKNINYICCHGFELFETIKKLNHLNEVIHIDTAPPRINLYHTKKFKIKQEEYVRQVPELLSEISYFYISDSDDIEKNISNINLISSRLSDNENLFYYFPNLHKFKKVLQIEIL